MCKFVMQRGLQPDILATMRAAFLPWSRPTAVRVGLMLGAALAAQAAQAQLPADDPGSTEVTNVHQIRLLAAQIPKASYNIRLEGDVWWANPARGRLVLKDDSGAEELE